jgi:hypothetical protein
MKEISAQSSILRMQRYANPRADLRNVERPDLSQDEALALLEGFRHAHPELTRAFADMATRADQHEEGRSEKNKHKSVESDA